MLCFLALLSSHLVTVLLVTELEMYNNSSRIQIFFRLAICIENRACCITGVRYRSVSHLESRLGVGGCARDGAVVDSRILDAAQA